MVGIEVRALFLPSRFLASVEHRPLGQSRQGACPPQRVHWSKLQSMGRTAVRRRTAPPKPELKETMLAGSLAKAVARIAASVVRISAHTTDKPAEAERDSYRGIRPTFNSASHNGAACSCTDLAASPAASFACPYVSWFLRETPERPLGAASAPIQLVIRQALRSGQQPEGALHRPKHSVNRGLVRSLPSDSPQPTYQSVRPPVCRILSAGGLAFWVAAFERLLSRQDVSVMGDAELFRLRS
jgi:hypothetical protein